MGPLNLLTYKELLAVRLVAKLTEKWHEYKQENWDEQPHVPLKQFAKWINREKKFGLNIKNTKSTTRQTVTNSPKGDRENRDSAKHQLRDDSPQRKETLMNHSILQPTKLKTMNVKM